jgi:hypothetical protein
VNLTISGPGMTSCISLFILILHCSPSFIGQYIFLMIFLSNLLSAFTSFAVCVQASDPYLSMGRICYICFICL